MAKRILDVNNLKLSFFTVAGEVKAVDNISYHVDEKEVVAIVGESGCGKSVSQLTVMQLTQIPPGKLLGGSVMLNGRDILQYPQFSKEMRQIRGCEISMIFQEPMTSLNPVFTVGDQLRDVIMAHNNVKRKEAWDIGTQALKAVDIPDPALRMKNYPFEMSGGMRQRVLIAMAVACNTDLIIADEPTTALDVTTQAQVIDLIVSLVDKLNSSLVVVTHNLGLVTRYANRIYVMYAGKFVESGTTEDLITKPKHPYTIGLLNSVPKITGERIKELLPIEGSPPSLIGLPDRCSFLPRCPYATEICVRRPFPELKLVADNDHHSACYNAQDLRRTK